MKKFLVFLIAICFQTICLFAFDKQEQVINGLRSGDYENVKVLLQEWEKDSPDDPDLMTGWFNYYLNRNLKSESIVGYMQNGMYGMYPKNIYDEDDLKVAISYLDKALKKNPYRMDIHFGKINSLLRAEHHAEGADAIANFLKVYDKNKTQWYWTNNQKFSDKGWNVEEAVIGGLHDYCKMFDFYLQAQRNPIKKALDEILKRFPKNVIFLNYMAYYYAAENDYNKSTEILLNAHKIDSNDYIIVANLASDYEKLGDYEEAEKWYKVLATMDSEEARAYAAKGLERIKDK
ncbi:MAG: hypothetical protein J5631_10970 [Spirochaetaceae bacterium]|nr:hypothetical protein [Spirochaetaceae bacterium]